MLRASEHFILSCMLDLDLTLSYYIPYIYIVLLHPIYIDCPYTVMLHQSITHCFYYLILLFLFTLFFYSACLHGGITRQSYDRLLRLCSTSDVYSRCLHRPVTSIHLHRSDYIVFLHSLASYVYTGVLHVFSTPVFLHVCFYIRSLHLSFTSDVITPRFLQCWIVLIFTSRCFYNGIYTKV